jgi:ribosomal protein S18 acetylase RimI-like enzyme
VTVNAPTQLEIRDLRQFSANSLRPVLEAESRVWRDRLAWDYRASTSLLLQYLDARVLPGFVAVEAGRVIGYAFCVYEDCKAVIGDVFALGDSILGHSQTQIESLLLSHIIELLQHSPGVTRIESQLLLHTHNLHAHLFEQAGFTVYRRIFMDLKLGSHPGLHAVPDGGPVSIAGPATCRATGPAAGPDQRSAAGPAARTRTLAAQGLQLRLWQESDFNPAGSLIANAYEGHLDSTINDQYRSVNGSLRFLHNIIRFPGCGTFDPEASHVLTYRSSGALAGIVLCSRVREDVEHVTQLCVAARARGAGLGTLLLQVAAESLAARGFHHLSLTVTGANERAVALYRRVGFVEHHAFDAMVWNHPDPARLKTARPAESLTIQSAGLQPRALA